MADLVGADWSVYLECLVREDKNEYDNICIFCNAHWESTPFYIFICIVCIHSEEEMQALLVLYDGKQEVLK